MRLLTLAAAVLIGVGLLRTGPAEAAELDMVLADLGTASQDEIAIAERRDWREYFQDISKGGIVISLEDRRLSYWSAGAERFMEFPLGVPRAEEFERTGRTSVVRKKVDPDWTPTASMRQRDPSLPAYMEAGPANPLGTRAMYLGWPAHLIHGTNDPTTIGKAVSSGCFRMFPQHVELLYDYVRNGTPVYVY